MLSFPFRENVLKSVQIRTFCSSVKLGIHASQWASLDDSLIQVDKFDNVLGSIPKLQSHLAATVTEGIFHRAFSVFLFSQADRSLLIQKRSPDKIVFPREWANTCCSHPLFVDSEMENENGKNTGIKRAAIKRLNIELGIDEYPLDSLSFREKILYSQLSPGGTFGESECDYILFGQMDKSSKGVLPNPDEVEAIEWVPPGPVGNRTKFLVEFLQDQKRRGFPATPWFNLMVEDRNCLEAWWNSLIERGDSFLKSEDINQGAIRDFTSR